MAIAKPVSKTIHIIIIETAYHLSIPLPPYAKKVMIFIMINAGNPATQPNTKFIIRHGNMINISIILYSCLIYMNKATRIEYTIRHRVNKEHHAKSVLLVTADSINNPIVEQENILAPVKSVVAILRTSFSVNDVFTFFIKILSFF
jgi:hypothetical protein